MGYEAAPPDQFTIDDFGYDEAKDVFVCPVGAVLVYAGTETTGRRRRRYRAAQSSCTACGLKARCTKSPRKQINVGACHAALVRLRADSHTESFKALYRTRAPVIEGIFGEGKLWHRLGRAWRRGLPNMLIQSLLVAAVRNFKRLSVAVQPPARLVRAVFSLLSALRRRMQRNGSTKTAIAPLVVAARSCN